MAYIFSANRCEREGRSDSASVTDHRARGKRWGGSGKKAERQREDGWYLRFRYLENGESYRTGQKGGSERGRVYCLLFSRERFYDRVSSLLYIRVKVEFRILVYLGHLLSVAGRSVSLLFHPFHSVVEQRQHGLFHLLNFILSYFIFFISIKIISGSCDKKERIFLSIGVLESLWDRSMSFDVTRMFLL